MKFGNSLDWFNVVLAFINMIIGAVNHNWAAMGGWFVAFLYTLRAVIENYNEE